MARRWSRTVRYDALAAYTSPSGVDYGTGVYQLHRIQSTNFRMSTNSLTSRGIGDLETRYSNEDGSRVTMTLDYFATDGWNEKKLGFFVDGIHGSVYGQYQHQQDCFLVVDDRVVNEEKVFAFGNMAVTSYSFSAALNQAARASVTLEGYNVEVVEGLSGNTIPRLKEDGTRYPYTFSLPVTTSGIYAKTQDHIDTNLIVQPRNVSVEIAGTGIFGVASGRHLLESINLDVAMPRSIAKNMNSTYPLSRHIQLPIDIDLSASFLVLDNEADQFRKFICDNAQNVTINLYKDCGLYDDEWTYVDKKVKLQYKLCGLRIDSVEYNASVEERMRVNVNWKMSLGNALDSKKNFWISGDFGKLAMVPDSYTYTTSGAFLETGELPIVRQVEYKMYKQDVVSPDFSFDFSGDFNYEDNHFFDWGISIVTGELDLLSANSGSFGSGIIPYYTYWNAALLPPRYENESVNPYRKNWSGIRMVYATGWQGYYDVPDHGYSNMYVKSEGLYNGPLFFSNIRSDNDSAGIFKAPVGAVSMDYPYFINGANLFCINPDTPTGTKFSAEYQVRSRDYKRNFQLEGITFYESYNYKVTSPTGNKLAVWYDFYDEFRYSKSGEQIYEVEDVSFFIKKNALVGSDNFGFVTGLGGTNRAMVVKTGDFPVDTSGAWDASFQHSGSGINLNNSYSIFMVGTLSSGYTDFDFYDSYPKLFSLTNSGNFNRGISMYLTGSATNPSGMTFKMADQISDWGAISIPNVNPYDQFILSVTYNANEDILNVRCNSVDVYSGYYTGAYSVTSEFSNCNVVRLFEKAKGSINEFMVSPWFFERSQVFKMEEYFNSKYIP